MKVTQGRPLDLSDEQSLSRQLIHEGRYLRQQPLTTRSVKLIDDLDRVFVELSNAGSRPPVPQFDVIRGGIRRENLLFKVRMAEGSFEDDGK